ncbi:methyltransferase domain-containing protein [Micromonospora sp. WMMD1128]|uniref:SAM-dependent methyltransferase n=1 Tax=Micromonospora sp. WMMD1128 TaxID=3015150 RepID=UPI00248B4310|nr:methyltransferase domain-containing protein [Micromonospora sp. WMMD1128]WBB75731.1 methyltransferase domain-containing protein [Micromonospora sp. WMMD1128]
MSTDFVLPTPEEVGAFYDRANLLITRFQGGNMHYGYWTGPDDDSSFEVAGQRLTDLLIDKLAPGAGDRVLDVGCGPGKPGVHLVRRTGADLVGISVSTRDVELANERAHAEGVADRAVFQVADATALPFPPDSFDAVLMLESIVHIPDRTRALTQAARVLRPGGRLALTDFVLRGEIIEQDEETRQAVAEALAAWRAAPLVRVEDYPRFVAEAGLVLDEIVDITAQTMRTYQQTHMAMHEYAKTHDDLPEDLARLVADPVDDGWDVEPDHVSEGVVVVVAHRPDAL